MGSTESGSRWLLLAAVVFLVSAVFTLDAGIRGAFPELLGFRATFLVLVGLQVGAAVSLLLRVRRPDSMFGNSE